MNPDTARLLFFIAVGLTWILLYALRTTRHRPDHLEYILVFDPGRYYDLREIRDLMCAKEKQTIGLNDTAAAIDYLLSRGWVTSKVRELEDRHFHMESCWLNNWYEEFTIGTEPDIARPTPVPVAHDPLVAA